MSLSRKAKKTDCFHVHLKRIIVGLVDNSNPMHGAYRCEDCKENLIVDLKPLTIKVKRGE